MRKAGVLFLIILLFINGVYALSVDMQQTYKARETVVTKISGNVLSPINSDMLVLKRGYVVIPMEYDVKKLGNDYYIWFVTPQNAGNYTLWINDVYTTISGVSQKIDFTQNFTIENGTSDYYIKPGFILSSKDFSITSVLMEDVSKQISVDFPESKDLNLEPGENKFAFSISKIDYTGVYTMNFGKYKLPMYILTNKTAPEGTNLTNKTWGEIDNETANLTNIKNITQNYSLEISPQKIKRTVYTGDISVYPITLKNDGLDNITDLELIYDKTKLTIHPYPVRLNSGEEFNFNLSVLNFEGNYVNENVTFRAGDEKIVLNVEINFTSNKTEAKFVPAQAGQPTFYCEELLGKVCATEEKCNEPTIQSKNGACCKGICQKLISNSSSYSWVGWIIAIVILGGIGFIYYKYRKVGNNENPLEKKVDEAKKKISMP